ncbi:spore coat U domain-containing protein [Caballeronia sp. AZ10_KS36]|uniref:Csu type fimbrial protein n=1 Tax=Caballeronia sp. AZ10_KS36 TaxID=2921757 RepID=UPI002028F8B7|nr:spore coat U domain-containing protein [Caballeronia sp. AZ10_KS36]
MRKQSERIRRTRARAVALGVSLALGTAAPVAYAASPKTTTFTVSLTIQADCSITANSLNFGTTGLITSNIDQATTMSVTCSSGTAYNVGLDGGSVSGSTVATRLLGGTGTPVPTVNFALYRDSARTQNWGQTVGTDTLSNTGSGSAQTLTVYGRVPPQNAPAAGAYSSTITTTVTF